MNLMEFAQTSSWTALKRHVHRALEALELDEYSRNYARKLLWNRALDGFVRSRLAQDAMWEAVDQLDKDMHHCGYEPADVWRECERFDDAIGDTYVLSRRYATSGRGPEVTVKLTTVATYEGAISLTACAVDRTGGVVLTDTVFQLQVFGLPSQAKRPWRVAHHLRSVFRQHLHSPQHLQWAELASVRLRHGLRELH